MSKMETSHTTKANLAFTCLICGKIDSSIDIGVVVTHLAETLDNLIINLRKSTESDELTFSLFGPYLCRSILEVSLAVLVGRIDPFRLLYLKSIQMHPKYNISQVYKSSIRWKGDIMLQEKVNERDMWDQGKEADKIPRALLGDYYEHVYWKPAFNKVLSWISGRTVSNQWLNELQLIEEKSFIPQIRSTIGRLYSSLSKGLHHEFVLPPGRRYDRPTVAALIDDAIKFCCFLGLASHAIDACHFKLEHEIALASLQKIHDEAV